MAAVTQLGYLGLSTKDVAQWENYATTTLDLETASRDPDGTLRLRMDGVHHRFAVHPGDRDDLEYMGWHVESAEAAAEIAARLEAAGTPVEAGSTEEAEKRRVAGLVRFADPDGNPLELAWGPQIDAHADTEGFVTGEMGLGHLVVYSSDLERSMDFYTTLLGMRVSDYVKAGRAHLGFLHCNPRHHSLAFAEVPRQLPQRINHFMLERSSLDDVGRRYDEVQSEGIPLIMGLGRHSNDHMVSFYMRNPSGYGVEYGWGGRQVDDATWCVEHLDSGSLWGHKPVPPPEKAG